MTLGSLGEDATTADFEHLVDYIDHWSALRPDDDVVVDGETRMTWRELSTRSTNVARQLVRLGVEPGDRVAVLTPQRWEFVVVYLALARIGGVFIGLNPRHTHAELDYVIRDAAPKVLMSIAANDVRDFVADVTSLHGEHRSIERLVWIGGDGGHGGERFEDLLEAPEGDDRLPDVLPSAPACIVYTSGSTGRPKGALLPRSGLLANYKAVARIVEHHPFVAQCDHPVDHVGGIDRLYLVVILGGKLVLASRFDETRLLEQISAERVTFWMGEATQFIRVWPHLRAADLSSVQIVNYVASLPEDLLRHLCETFPLVMTGYGMTELCSAAVKSRRDTSEESLSRGVVGRPLDTMLVRLVDAEDREVAMGAPGELQIRSCSLLLEYVNRPEATAEAFTADGWFRTGDLMTQDTNGDLTFLARLGDVLKSGGYNVYPREIEAVLEGHPEVVEAAVVPVDDAVYQQVAHAFVVLNQPIDEAALSAFCREQLASYKVPRRFHQMESLPRLANQKIDKVRLRSDAASASPSPS